MSLFVHTNGVFMANHNGPTTLLRDGLVVVQTVHYDEDAEPPHESSEGVGVHTRSDRGHRFRFLNDYAIDDIGHAELSCRFDDMAEALGDVSHEVAPQLYSVVADLLPTTSVWHRKGQALLAMLRLGGASDEPNRSTDPLPLRRPVVSAENHLGPVVAKLRERISAMFDAGSDYRLRDALDQTVWKLAGAMRSDMLRRDPLTADAVFLTCRGFDTAYERDWDVLCLAGDDDAPNTFENVFGVWTPDDVLREELNGFEDRTVRRAKALQFARECLVDHNHYINGDVYACTVSVFKPIASAVDSSLGRASTVLNVNLDANEYQGVIPLASCCYGTYYGHNDTESGLDEALDLATRDAVGQALTKIERHKADRLPKRQRSITPAFEVSLSA